MTARAQKSEEILDAAERMVRQGGYNAFSFRDIATAVGVKSASVHYHFPTKEALGTALAERYTQGFLGTLGDPLSFPSPAVAIARYVDTVRQALLKDRMMCLCGMLGAEFSALPAPVQAETRAFFLKNTAWLEKALGGPQARAHALHIIATVEGAMILARTMENVRIYDQATEELLDTD